jgi:hypothetical protein
MRHATILLVFGSFALLLSATDTLAQESSSEAQAPLAAAYRDAQYLSECMKALDTDCVVSLSDAKSYTLLNGREANLAEQQAHYYTFMKKKGYRYLAFDVAPPRDLYIDDGRMYTFVTFTVTSNWGGHLSTGQGYFISLSRDGGDSWTFVYAGPDFTLDMLRAVIPSYNGQPLPATRWIDGPP